MRTQNKYEMPASAGAYLPYLPFVYFTIATVRQAVGLSTSRIYDLIRQGEFPAGNLIGAQSRRWKSTDIANWLIEQSEKAAQREGNPPNAQVLRCLCDLQSVAGDDTSAWRPIAGEVHGSRGAGASWSVAVAQRQQ